MFVLFMAIWHKITCLTNIRQVIILCQQILLEAVCQLYTTVEDTCAVESDMALAGIKTETWSEVNSKTERNLLEEDTEFC